MYTGIYVYQCIHHDTIHTMAVVLPYTMVHLQNYSISLKNIYIVFCWVSTGQQLARNCFFFLFCFVLTWKIWSSYVTFKQIKHRSGMQKLRKLSLAHVERSSVHLKCLKTKKTLHKRRKYLLTFFNIIQSKSCFSNMTQKHYGLSRHTFGIYVTSLHAFGK